MNIDIRTLGFVICLVDWLLVLVLMLQYRTSKNYQGPGWWVLGLVSTSVGIFLMSLRDYMDSKLISIILANVLFVLGSFLIYTGVMRFLGKRENKIALLAILLVMITGFAGYTYAQDDIGVRIAIVSGSLAIVSFMTSWALFVHRLDSVRVAALFTGIVLTVFSIIFLIRSADALFFTSVESLFAQGWFQIYGFLTILITHILLTFGLVFMINQRLRGEMHEIRESLTQSEHQYQTFINSTPDIVYLKDDQLRYQMINEAQSAFFGKPESELLGKTDYDLMPADAAEHCTNSDLAVLEINQTIINYEQVGDLIYETRKFPVQLTDGKSGVGAFIRDITESRRAEEALAREQYLMNALMNNLPDHIYFKDRESRFIRINRAHAQTFRLSLAGEEIGKTDFDFFTEEHARKAYEDEQEIIRTGQPMLKEERETWAERPDTWASSIKMPLINQAGETIGTFGISRDITERKQTDEEIVRKNQQLRQMNAEKDKLFSIIAHDLRSPFNALLGLTELMTDESTLLSLSEMRKMAGMLRKSANSVNKQLGNLLEWSRIQMNVISVDPVLLNLKTLVDTESELFTEAAQHKNISLINSISDNILVTADKQMLHSILRNLIANAIKFTRPGGEVSLAADRGSDRVIEISVSDSGIGMSQELLDKLFSLNDRVYRTGTEGEPSSGLGLIICKELIAKLGGRIWAESVEGVGSVFRFTLRS